MKLAAIFILWVEIAEKVFKVRGQRPRSYVYRCVNAVMTEAYILTLWHRDLLVCHICAIFSQTTVLSVHIAMHYTLSCRTATAEKCGHFWLNTSLTNWPRKWFLVHLLTAVTVKLNYWVVFIQSQTNENVTCLWRKRWSAFVNDISSGTEESYTLWCFVSDVTLFRI